jgi:stage V sporulation protein B
MNELSYTKNTLYLVLAGIFSQLFSALQKIILTRYLKEEGMAIYQSALCVYSVFLTLACGGMPLAITHFISKERSRGRENDIYSGLRFVLFVMCFFGLLLSLLMFFTRRFFGAAMKDAGAEYAIAALSPSVFIVAAGAVAKSCFEGYSNMLPCAVSQVLESIVKLALAYFLTALLCAFSASYAAFGGALAITLGETFATAVLFMFFAPFIRKIKSADCKINTSITAYALPLTVYAIILSSLELLENAVIRNSLLSLRFSQIQAKAFLIKYSPYTSVFNNVTLSGRLTLNGARWLYGAFFGYAMTVIRFPAGLLRIFSVSLFPLAAKHFAKGDYDALGKHLSGIIRIMLFISMPVCAVIIVFSHQITQILFGCSVYSSMIRAASPLLVIAPILSVLSSAEYASGRTLAPFLFSFISYMISIPLCFILIRVPNINILGTAISLTVGVSCELIMSYFFITRRLKIKIDLFQGFFTA